MTAELTALVYDEFRTALYRRDMMKIQDYITRGIDLNAVYKINDIVCYGFLEFACLNDCDWKIIKLLIDNGARFSKRIYNLDPFGYVVIQGFAKIIELLLTIIPDINAYVISRKIYPLHDAIDSEHPRIAQLLINAGIDVNLQNGDGFTALHCAVEIKNVKMVRLLLKSGADVHIRTFEGTAPIDFISSKVPEVLTMLLAAGADPNSKDESDDDHSFIFACSLGWVDHVQIYLCAGVDINIRSANGKTGLEKARKYEQHHIVQLLENYPPPLQSLCQMRLKMHDIRVKLGLSKKIPVKRQRKK